MHFDLLKVRMTSRGALYDVIDRATGEKVVEGAKDPEHELCRELVRRGVNGVAWTYFPGSSVARMKLPIKACADRMVQESASVGPRIVAYREFETDAFKEAAE
jgi:hypothetical protein